MGEKQQDSLRLHCDGRLRLAFCGAKVTSDAGLLACRELDDALGLTEAASAHVREPRTGRNMQHQLVALCRQAVSSRLAGYEDTNDAERLAQDPALRVVGRQAVARQAASTNTLSRFETAVLTRGEHLAGVAHLHAHWVEQAMRQTPYQRVILDLDSSESPVYGAQEGAASNGHFQSV